ncbi:Trk system potassium uptake protein trkA [Dermatophilus congolensis]|uniref:Trk system potassium uptake protein trkA n=1 Tax=Dermatophilus congolensis TaxID=1863 RepID=A0A239VPJ8_9MICO|nr:Trk system potassium uptake protein trkA [Dermatophilus congolensis]
MGSSRVGRVAAFWSDSAESGCCTDGCLVYGRDVHFVIMGCGRVGASLSRNLAERGHDVAVIDQDRRAFRRLGADFEGRRVVGQGFDREVLIKAGIENAYACAAVSSGDNSNILTARLARETFGVQNVVARIYDPGRAAVYQRLGIPTVGTVRWTSDRIMRRLLPHGATPQHADPSGRVVVAEVALHHAWIGLRYSTMEQLSGARVAYVMRFGEGMIPTAEHVYQAGDIVSVITTAEALGQTERILESAPEFE